MVSSVRGTTRPFEDVAGRLREHHEEHHHEDPERQDHLPEGQDHEEDHRLLGTQGGQGDRQDRENQEGLPEDDDGGHQEEDAEGIDE